MSLLLVSTLQHVNPIASNAYPTFNSDEQALRINLDKFSKNEVCVFENSVCSQ